MQVFCVYIVVRDDGPRGLKVVVKVFNNTVVLTVLMSLLLCFTVKVVLSITPDFGQRNI